MYETLSDMKAEKLFEALDDTIARWYASFPPHYQK